MTSPFSFPPTLKMLPTPQEAITDRSIRGYVRGRVRFRGSFWNAQLFTPDQQTSVAVGEPVQVVAIRGNTLLVIPMHFDRGG